LASKIRGMQTFDPSKLLTQNDLEECLRQIGFKPEPALFKNIIIMRDVAEKFVGEPCVWLEMSKNKLELDCVVSVEDQKICVYYYEFHNDLFRLWCKFSSEISGDELAKTIRSASNRKQVMERY
jgi:hypothetical protein